MRELTSQDVQDVNGGSQITDGASLILTGITIAKLAGIAGAGVATALIASPLVAVFGLGLVATGGYVIGGAIPSVSIGPDFSVSVDRNSEC